jgi:hypothetical protein
MNHFKELKVWQKAVDLSVEVYSQTRQFPTEEKLNAQIQQIQKMIYSLQKTLKSSD